MADAEERTPLLKDNSGVNGAEEPPPYTATTSSQVTVPPIAEDELPPPYTATSQGGLPMINCKICQAMINIEGKSHLHVVKCSVCHEATPIKAAPPEKKYVRCPCNCLLICRSSAQRIACPRQNCRRVINLSGGMPSVTLRTPGSGRIACVYCNQIFIFDVNTAALARCPHCRKLSSVANTFARRRGHLCLSLGLFFLAAGIGTTIGTVAIASSNGGIYVVWIASASQLVHQRPLYVLSCLWESAYKRSLAACAFITGIILLIRAAYYYSIKTSFPVGTS